MKNITNKVRPFCWSSQHPVENSIWLDIDWSRNLYMYVKGDIRASAISAVNIPIRDVVFNEISLWGHWRLVR